MLELVLDVGEPWLGAPGVSLDVLLVWEVVLGLRIESAICTPAFFRGGVAIPPTPGLAGDRMPERGWMTSRDAMFLVSLDSDCCASVARDVESNRGKGAAGKIEVMRRVGTASLLRSRRGGVARWRERDGVGRWQLEVRVESSSWCVFLFGLRVVRPFRRLGANSKRTQVQDSIVAGYFLAGLASVQPVLGSEWARAGNPGFAAELTFRRAAAQCTPLDSHHCSDRTAKLTWKLHHHSGSRPAECQHLQASAATVHHIPSFPSI